jgi:polyisoprenoid-binding protein YceI
MKSFVPLAVALAMTGSVVAAPVTYEIDPNHTIASFEADHMGGLSVRRGRFNTTTSGKITLDREGRTGTVDITIDAASIDFGLPKLEDHVRSPEMLDVAKYPTITYQGKLTSFENGAPTKLEGMLTMHGVTKPLTLDIDQFLCKQHPMKNVEVCGADAVGTLNRGDYGIDYGLKMGFKPEVKIEVQVEANPKS